ncbi:MAG: hypothetical protein VKL00_11695 [Synechococcales bacterium]|nr:hypothetical protein [Synechococcales bacterium]
MRVPYPDALASSNCCCGVAWLMDFDKAIASMVASALTRREL